MKPFDSDSIPIMKYVDELNVFPFPSNKVSGLTKFEVVLFYDVFRSDDKSNVLVVTIYWLNDRWETEAVDAQSLPASFEDLQIRKSRRNDSECFWEQVTRDDSSAICSQMAYG